MNGRKIVQIAAVETVYRETARESVFGLCGDGAVLVTSRTPSNEWTPWEQLPPVPKPDEIPATEDQKALKAEMVQVPAFEGLFPWSEFSIGENRLFAGSLTRVASSASRFKRKNPGWDYKAKSEACGIRVWRLA